LFGLFWGSLGLLWYVHFFFPLSHLHSYLTLLRLHLHTLFPLLLSSHHRYPPHLTFHPKATHPPIHHTKTLAHHNSPHPIHHRTKIFSCRVSQTRIIFRFVEFSGSVSTSNPILTNEGYVLGLDGFPMVIALVALNAVHPGMVLKGPESSFPRGWRRRPRGTGRDKNTTSEGDGESYNLTGDGGGDGRDEA